MTHVYNTTYVCCIQIKWDDRGCDRLQVSPDTRVSYPTTCQKHKLMSRWHMSNMRLGPPLLLPALCASPKRTSVMLLGSLWDLPRCNTQSSSSPSDDAMVNREAQCKTERCDHRQPRSPASSGGADLMWLGCCSCSSWSQIRSSAGEIHYARSIMPPSSAARKNLL